MKRRTDLAGQERNLWLVERETFSELQALMISLIMGPSVRLRLFTHTEAALDALERGEPAPDLLMTAFYFNGFFNNGLWLVRETHKRYPDIATVVTSGFSLDHLRGAADDWCVKPDLILPKGNTNLVEDWLPAISRLLIRSSTANPVHRRVQSVLDNRRMARQTDASPLKKPRPGPDGRPLVFLVGPGQDLSTLRVYLEQTIQLRVKNGYDWQYFSRPESAWEALSEANLKPDYLVTDYYLDGNYINGLKLVRHAQRTIPDIQTIMISWFNRHHLSGAMEGTGIAPDWFFPRS